MNVVEFIAQTFTSAIEKTFGTVAEAAMQGFIETGKEILEKLGADTSEINDLESLAQATISQGLSAAGKILAGGRGGGCAGGCSRAGCSKAADNAAAAAEGVGGTGDGGGGEGAGGGGGGDGAGTGGPDGSGEALASAVGDSLDAAGEAGGAIGEEATNQGAEGLEGGMEACTNPRGQDKPAIELGELAQHALVLGDLFMKLFNEHVHTKVQKGGDESGPPKQKMTCAEHLSHVTFTIQDPWDQPPSPLQERMVRVGKKFLSAPSAPPSAPPPPSSPPSQSRPEDRSQPEEKKGLLEAADEFCQNPGKVVGDAARGAGVPDEIVDCAEGVINKGVKTAVDAGITAVENAVGIDLPDMDTVCEVVNKVKEGKWLGALFDVAKQAVKTVLPAVVTAATGGLVPPQVTNAVLNGVEKVLDGGGSKEDAAAAAAAIGEAVGRKACEGLTALGGMVGAGVVDVLTEGL